jgi:hypothetical protein
MEIILIAVVIALIPATVAGRQGRSFGAVLLIALVIMFSMLFLEQTL